jgi:hypothetical protein
LAKPAGVQEEMRRKSVDVESQGDDKAQVVQTEQIAEKH